MCLNVIDKQSSSATLLIPLRFSTEYGLGNNVYVCWWLIFVTSQWLFLNLSQLSSFIQKEWNPVFIRSSRCTNSFISNRTGDFIFNKVHFVELTLPPLHSRIWRNISAVNIQNSYLKLEPIRVMQHSIRVVLYFGCGFLKPSSET